MRSTRYAALGTWMLVAIVAAKAPWADVGARVPVAPSGETILRRAELARNPFLGVGVDIDLQVVTKETGRHLRNSNFLMLTHRADRTLLVMRQSDPSRPGALLIADDSYSLLLPDAEAPAELALGHVVAGDLSHAGVLRVNLRLRYLPRSVSEASIDGVPCWELELEPRKAGELFGSVRYLVAKEGLLPVRIEYRAPDGELLKTARFVSFRATGLGPAPERIAIEDAHRPRELAILTLSDPVRVDTYMLDFDLQDLFALREAAGRLGADGSLTVEALVDALRTAEGEASGEEPR